ncbi:nucleotidyl transferase AbiEii/AbiGii toxin family protein (plasmid) [Cupriavidus pinatubonensis]|uniref:nucleotidyl transferase AbiEii/AbiGii toxin family protein n=1 Tax=Cupriavidus pinatubonensis TaxID=248026 RepID=UPI001C739BCA|nr:nucleotidyl transferase AbiEii/AbiGii toxin family protein [Cupriavidus pinatubonensis]QYY33613.1 nucleotidyl transferase AbiEii/AbiGii toxin family protein [Cupriavidus pinatubonensis]
MASLAHFLTLNALSQSADFHRHALTFQGGTSLALAWASPRFSEDLDFIAGGVRPEQLSEAMHLVAREVQRAIAPFYPGAQVDLADKSGNGKQLAMFQIGVTLPGVVGKVKVKTEFWKVPDEKAAQYQRVHRALAPAGGASLYTTVRPIFQVATPKQIFFDKLNAIAHRGRLKPRDVFDVWFLTTQLRQGAEESPEAFDAAAVYADVPEFLESMDNTAALYDQAGTEAIPGLQAFVEMPMEEVMAHMETGLRPWIAPAMWNSMWPDTVRQMVDVTKLQCSRAIKLLVENGPAQNNASTPSRPAP